MNKEHFRAPGGKKVVGKRLKYCQNVGPLSLPDKGVGIYATMELKRAGRNLNGSTANNPEQAKQGLPV